jgi:hypothetical protein
MIDMVHALVSSGASGHGFDVVWPRFVVYELAAVVCAWQSASRNLVRHMHAHAQALWSGLCVLYLLVALSCLVQGDVLWVQWVRAFSRTHQLYEERRFFQVALLLALPLLAMAAWRQYWRMPHPSTACASVPRGLLLTGATGTLVLYLLRYVSFHYTDRALNTLLFGHSVAIWVECAALGLTGLGAGLALLRGYQHV